MKTVQVELYEFDELNDKAKAKAIAHGRDTQDLDDCQDFLTERFKEIAAEYGFQTAAFNWSLGHCQGDGVSFTTSKNQIDLSFTTTQEQIDLKKLLQKLGHTAPAMVKAHEDGELSIGVKRTDHHYQHQNTVHAYVEARSEKFSEKRRNALQDLVEKAKDAVCKQCEKEGYAEYDDQTSDHTIAENLRANEAWFLIDGKRWC